MKLALKTLLSIDEHPPCEVSVLLTNRDVIRTMNREYRGIDQATDVLTFVAAPNPSSVLGDIAIAVDVALSQAEARKIPLAQELTYLALHGGLHLLGMDDETDGERDAMIARMNEIAVVLGMPPDEDWHTMSEVMDG